MGTVLVISKVTRDNSDVCVWNDTLINFQSCIYSPLNTPGIISHYRFSIQLCIWDQSIIITEYIVSVQFISNLTVTHYILVTFFLFHE